MIPASKFGSTEEAQEELVLTDEEKKIEEQINVSCPVYTCIQVKFYVAIVSPVNCWIE